MFWQLVEQHRVSNLFTVPTIVKLLVEHDGVDRHDHSSLRYVIYAGAPMYRADQKLALEKLGKVLVQYFGLGEVTGNITVLPPRDAQRRRRRPERQHRLLRPAAHRHGGRRSSTRRLQPLPAGEIGEICCRGPAVFAGYHDNPEATAKALRGGWFHTGDLGRLDARGLLYITGRESDMYISGGSNVYPREVEEAAADAPGRRRGGGARRARSPSGARRRGGGRARATAPTPVDEAALLAHLDGRCARYRWPRQVFFWDALPKSGYGKIAKKDIRRLLVERGSI